MSYYSIVIAGLIAGPIYAWGMTTESWRKAYDERLQRFRDGKGKDPSKAPIGAHKPFWENAVAVGLLFMLVLGALVNLGLIR